MANFLVVSKYAKVEANLACTLQGLMCWGEREDKLKNEFYLENNELKKKASSTISSDKFVIQCTEWIQELSHQTVNGISYQMDFNTIIC